MRHDSEEAMTEPAVSSSAAKRRVPPPAPRAAWDQQPGENALWYARFLRYVALGPDRSVSLVSTGERNHYPVPAHWPMVAKQRNWRVRARAFDEAARKDEALMTSTFVSMFTAARMAAPPDEADKMMGIMYQPPPHDEDEQDSSTA